ncbi:hypothetical protein RHGRI_015805 [Rhododendron griersonianum]|uniref:ATP-dependent DNA helicase n=1 Tax=Rhododendron griersonianum TaxID=479676 RepID=A0AAV6JTC0_9ERIC|nr:hypothetical protein RHGRI_015805 [Rhododendron griersonianum]
MLTNKRSRTSCSENLQDTNDRQKQLRNDLESTLATTVRDKRNERRRRAYAKRQNTCITLTQSAKDIRNERRKQLRETQRKQQTTRKSGRFQYMYENTCSDMIQTTMTPTETPHARTPDFVIQTLPSGTIPVEQEDTQLMVAGVIREVPRSSTQYPSTRIPEIGSKKTGDQIAHLRRRSIPTKPFVLPNVAYCVHCDAKRFPSEPDGFCCSRGQVSIYPLRTPNTLLDLYRGSSKLCKDFRAHIRPYNNMFAFTSFRVTLDSRYTQNHQGIYTFRAQGQIYHFLNSLYPADKKPSYLQLYFYDTAKEVEHRLDCLQDLDSDTIAQLIAILEPNPYSKFFRSLSATPNIDSYQIRLKADPVVNDKTYDAPTASQVALIWKDNEDASELRERDILVEKHDGHSVAIKYYYGCYDPLQYPLLFPYGEPGWHRGIKRNSSIGRTNKLKGAVLIRSDETKTVDQLLALESLYFEQASKKQNTVTAREFYAYRFQIRPKINSIILESGRLLQQYAVDMYVKIETSRLDYFRHNQDEIRSDLYKGVIDSVAQGESRGSKIGTPVILPGTFIGGPRDMHKRYLDAMTLVDKYGKPDIFLTMTCNPRWIEITNELKPHEDVQNRPDLVARVFRSKFELMKKEVIKKKLFGPVRAYTYVIEFQKRGLPHAHLLLIFKRGHKLLRSEQFDQFITAEIPCEKENPHLYAAVLRHMMHGPCGKLNQGNVCMKNGKCKNHYPKKFTETTTVAADGYPIYKRRYDKKQVQIRGQILDNRWVVPYNPYLLAMLDCHVNVEICSTIKAVKYLYKYIYKGHDKIVFKVIAQRTNEVVDEIAEFQTARWVTPPEAMWRIYKFHLFDMQPSVITLQLHLEGCQVIGFRKSTNLDTLADSEFFSRTMLTQFFYMNKHNEKARQGNFLYKDFPTAFVWSRQTRFWTERQHKNVIGRIVAINPTQCDLYYLRLLLNHIPCPTSFLYLKTVRGEIYSTYREAAVAHGLLVDDKGNEKCLEEACGYQMPNSFRQLFCTMLVFCGALNPKELLLKFEEPLTEDYVRRQKMLPTEARQCLLRFVKSTLEGMGKTLQDFGLADLFENEIEHELVCREILEEQNINVSEIDLLSISKLNAEQLKAYNEIMQAVRKNNGTCFFIDGPGGTGKTFLYRAVLAAIRSARSIALATATSGVAASILPNGRTAHSRFKIPLDKDGKLSCNVGKQTGLAKLLRATSLIIWDEASMAKRQSIEALDNLLRDITDVDKLFGGKVVVLGGDFRQVLPVIPKGTREECIDASLVRSQIWSSLEKITLTENMRAKTDPAFSSYLLRVGNGEEPSNSNDEITIPPLMTIALDPKITPMEQLINFVFPDLRCYFAGTMPTTQSAILAPTNESVNQTNELLINRFPGRECVYLSTDETINPADQGVYVDFMHSVCPPGLPAHRLVLKENCPIIMLRNLDPSKGLCNGTRLICRALHKHVIVAQIAVGEHRGDIVFIPRISLQPTDVKLYPVQFTRRQFPLRLCFAMTINKAQGQTLDTVGINLQQPVFSHGQLYVALSRATTAARIKVILNAFYDGKEEQTSAKNIVYREILSHYSYLNYGREIMDDNERERGNDGLDGEGNGGGKSNAKVEVTPSDYRIVDNPLQWTLSSRTPIEEIPDAVYNIRDVKYQFVELQDLNEYVRDTRGFDVIFAILHVGPKRTTKDKSTIQNISIIDASKVPTTLVLWEQFADHEGEIMGTLEGPFPIVQGTRMKVSTYLGYQLTTRGSSTFSFNPPIPSAEKLRKWCMANANTIHKLPVSERIMNVTPMRNETPNVKNPIKINQLPTMVDKQEFHWIQAICKVVDLTQRFWYLTCSKCNNATDAISDGPFWCNHCKARVSPVANLKFNIELSDKTGSIVATVYPRDAEGMFGITAEYLKENLRQGELSPSAIEKLCVGVEYAVRVKAYNYTKYKLPNCLYSIHEYDLLNKTKRDMFYETADDSTSKAEKPPKKSRTISTAATGRSASKGGNRDRRGTANFDEIDGGSASKVETTRRQSRNVSADIGGGLMSNVEKPRGKSRRQLFSDKPSNPATNEDDLPLAIAFGKKKKN